MKQVPFINKSILPQINRKKYENNKEEET